MRFSDIILKEFKIKLPADGEGMGIPRKRMPQIKSKDYPEYFKYLKDNGVNFKKIDGVKAATLKPTQSEFSKQGVEKQLDKIWNKSDDSYKPLIASSDDYIIDGHHRWLVAKNTRSPLNVFKADVPMRELMALTLQFPKVYFKDIYNEGYKIQLERDTDMYVLHITDTKSGKRTEVRGKGGYESGSYDANDKLHQLLDKIGKSANISELINGEVVTINPKHPDATKAQKAADVAFNEDITQGRNLSPDTEKYIKDNKWRLTKVNVADLDIDAFDDIFNRVIDVDPDHPVNFKDPIVVHADGSTIIDGFHRAYQAREHGLSQLPAYVPESINEAAGVGRVVPGVNTTVDVGPNEIIKQVKKYGNDVDRDGKPRKHLR